jgi:hypothetical protein
MLVAWQKGVGSGGVDYDPWTGQFNKDLLPPSPTRAPDPTVYHFTEVSGPIVLISSL